MKKFGKNSIGVETGTAHLFSDFAENGEMWAGNGDRATRTHVRFSETYLTPPQVHAGLSLWDIASQSNIRADLRVENIKESGFDIVFVTWGDSKVARARANWMAIGEVPDDEIWDV